MSRSDEELTADILEAIDRCARYRNRFHDDDAEVVEMAFEAAIRSIGVIGEAANHLSPSVTDEMRNIIVHEYFAVDTDIVVTTLDRDLAPLASALREHPKEKTPRSGIG